MLPTLRFAGLKLNPDLQALPGAAELQHLVNGVAGWALLAALVALVIGAVGWAFGSHAHNVHQAAAGRRAVFVSAAAAMLIGSAPVLINFFFDAGTKLR